PTLRCTHRKPLSQNPAPLWGGVGRGVKFPQNSNPPLPLPAREGSFGIASRLRCTSSTLLSEAVRADFFGDQLLEPIHRFAFFLLELPPKVANGRLGVGVRGVLIEPPQRVQPFAQLVHQIMIMVLDLLRLPNLRVFAFQGRLHQSSSIAVPASSESTSS